MADVRTALSRARQLGAEAYQDIRTRAPEGEYRPTLSTQVEAPQVDAVSVANRILATRKTVPQISSFTPTAVQYTGPRYAKNGLDFSEATKYQEKYGRYVPEIDKPANQPKKNIIQKALGILSSKPITAVATALDAGSRSFYTGLSVLLNPIASGISTGVQKLSGDTRSAADLYKENYSVGNQTAVNTIKGQLPVEMLLNTTDLKDNSWAYAGAVIADTLLNPINRLSFASKGISVANEFGDVVNLSKSGTAAYKAALTKATKGLEIGSPEFAKAERKIAAQFVKESPGSANAASKGIRLASNDISIGKFKLKGGEINIPGGEKVMAGTEAAKRAVVTVMHKVPGFDKAADTLKGAFVSATDRIGNQVASDIANDYKKAVTSEMSNIDNKIAEYTRGLSKEEKLAILTQRQAIETGEKILSENAMAKAQEIYKLLDSRVPIEQAARIPVEPIQHYMPQLYKEGYDVITQKLTDAKLRLFKMVKAKKILSTVQQDLLDLFKSDAGDLKRIADQPYFVNDKFLKNAEMALEVGLTPVDDLSEVLKSRLSSSVEAVAKNHLTMELDNTFGAKAIAQYQTMQGKIEAIRQSISGEARAKLEKFMKRADVQKELRTGGTELVDGFMNKLGRNAKSLMDEARSNLETKIYGSGDLVTRTMEVDGEKVGIKISKEMNDVIDRALEAVKADGKGVSIPDWLKGPLKVYDANTRMFKTFVTTYFPKFYIRNVVDSTFRNIQDVGLFNVLRPTAWQDSMKMSLMSDARAATKWGEDIVTYGGREYTLSELRKFMDNSGVTQTLRQAEGINKPFRKIGDPVENFSRIQSFLLNLEKTGSPSQAAKASLKYQFDYTSLTPFERGVMQRIFPFYTFRSRNLTFQLGEILKNPGPYMTLSQLRTGMERRLGSSTEDQNVPDYIRSSYAIPLYKDDKGNTKYLGGFGLSFEDADSLLSSFTNARRLEQNLGSSLNPSLRLATEYLRKRNMFVGADYGEYNATNGKYQKAALEVMNTFAPNFTQLEKGQYTNKAGVTNERITADSLAISIASSLPSSRITSVASDFMREDKSFGEALRNQFNPGKVYTVSPDYAEQQDLSAKYKENDKELQKLFQQGVLARGQNNAYYVSDRYSTGDPVKDSILRERARQLLDKKIK